MNQGTYPYNLAKASLQSLLTTIATLPASEAPETGLMPFVGTEDHAYMLAWSQTDDSWVWGYLQGDDSFLFTKEQQVEWGTLLVSLLSRGCFVGWLNISDIIEPVHHQCRVLPSAVYDEPVKLKHLDCLNAGKKEIPPAWLHEPECPLESKVIELRLSDSVDDFLVLEIAAAGDFLSWPAALPGLLNPSALKRLDEKIDKAVKGGLIDFSDYPSDGVEFVFTN